MIDWQASKEALIQAPSKALFDIVSDVAKHNELAGSGEVLRVRKITDGPVGVGTVIEADEKLPVGDESMDVVARSAIVAYDPPHTISWISAPAGLPIRRIQWWFNFEPQQQGTKVIHQVEIDFGNQTDPQMIGLRDNYDALRGKYVTKGMENTLQNLQKIAA